MNVHEVQYLIVVVFETLYFQKQADYFRANYYKLKPQDFFTYLNKLKNNWQYILTYQSNLGSFVSEMLTLK